ncbi:hypothetical protein MRX96_024559 [Rhipicephalus microplus]
MEKVVKGWPAKEEATIYSSLTSPAEGEVIRASRALDGAPLVTRALTDCHAESGRHIAAARWHSFHRERHPTVFRLSSAKKPFCPVILILAVLSLDVTPRSREREG